MYNTIQLLYLFAFVLAVATGNVFNNDSDTVFALVPLAIAGIGAGAQLLGGIISGGRKRRAAKRAAEKAAKDKDAAKARSQALIDDLKKNPYRVADESRSALSLAEQEMNSGSYQAKLDATADNALAGYLGNARRGATSGADLIAAAQKGFGMSQEQKANNAVTAEQKRQADIGRVMAAKSEIAQQRDMEWQRNVYLPFAQSLELEQGELNDAASRYNNTMPALVNSAGVFGEALAGAGSVFGSLAGSDLFSGGGTNPNTRALVKRRAALNSVVSPVTDVAPVSTNALYGSLAIKNPFD